MKTTSVHVHWILNRNIKTICEIEKTCFVQPWEEEDFLKNLAKKQCIGICAELNDEVVGYAVYFLHKKHIEILNFAVNSKFRRKKIGTALLKRIISLSNRRRVRIDLVVPETNLPTQLFLREMGFKATKVIKNHFAETKEDAYEMQFEIPQETLTRV